MTDQTWNSPNPTHCQICENKIKHRFVDGRTKSIIGTLLGPWAVMCIRCHGHYGVGLGTGRGQKYRREAHRPGLRPDDVFVKVNG